MTLMIQHYGSLSSKPTLGNLCKKIQLCYYQYEVTFGLYVLTPTEKIITNTLVLSFCGLLIFAMVALAPLFIIQVISKAMTSLFWVYVNENGNQLVVRHTPSPWVNATHIGWEDFGGYAR
ncbi:hypothetical protein ONS96_000611 [Cadophora gregata f. sp. sojae]|nr:hypothetical protein ONS96_000611 [Cadophora gregata f. sp. sojae]